MAVNPSVVPLPLRNPGELESILEFLPSVVFKLGSLGKKIAKNQNDEKIFIALLSKPFLF